MNKVDRPTGQLYSRIYLRPDAPLEDSPRARRRLAVIMKEAFRGDVGQLCTLIERELGVIVPKIASYWESGLRFDEFIHSSALRDLLDTITLAAALLKADRRRPADFIGEVRRVFAEEHLGYEIDDEGGIHPLVDQEFSEAKQATIRALNDTRFGAARENFEGACYLIRDDPDRAIELTFKAAENLFKQLLDGKAAGLDARTIEKHLARRFEALYGGNPAARQAAAQMCASFRNWVNAAHKYRHAPGHPAPARAPFDLAVLMVSQGAGYIRWLAKNFDELRRAG